MSVCRLSGQRRACPRWFRAAKLWTACCGFPLALVVSGCVGTPWGERLSGSFPPPAEPLPGADSPGTQSPTPQSPVVPPVRSRSEAGAKPSRLAPSAPSPPTVPGAPSTPSPASGAPVRPVAAPPPQAGGRPQPPASQTPLSPSPTTPFPYRVTLRLPRADPSAPAEAVTRALRAAEIPFEVETIERVKGGAVAPQGLEGAPGVPSVRPAPPPR